MYPLHLGTFVIPCLGPEPPENIFSRIHESSAIGSDPEWTSWYDAKLLDAAAMAEANVGNN